LEKADRTNAHLQVGHYEERPISVKDATRLTLDRQTTLDVIGSKWSYALNWCKLDDYEDVPLDHCDMLSNSESSKCFNDY